MILLDPNGRVAKRTTETQFPRKLVEMLIALNDLLTQNGLSLYCMKCHRLGLPDGVKADNRPESDTYTLECGCARRVFNKQTGRERVQVH